MSRLIIFVIFFFHNTLFAQSGNQPSCKIEFYLLKTFIPGKDTSQGIMQTFSADASDLEKTPFITNNEILGYSFKADTLKQDGKTMIFTRQVFTVIASASDRINKLDLPLCCGRQFARL